MSLLFDAAADRILRTTDLLDYKSSYTWMAWFYPTATTGTRTLMSLNDNGGTYDFFGLISGLTLYLETEGGSDTHSTLGAASTWYHITLQRDTNTLRIFLNGVQDGADLGSFVVLRGAGSRMEMGGFESGNANPFQGLIAYIKAWASVLTQPQIAAEKDSIAAIVTANLYGEWKTQSASRFADSSGNGRDWTEVNSVPYDGNFPFTEGSDIVLFRRILEGDR